MPKRAEPADDESLKRLGGGRWQTRDERFTIEPQSGTWAVVDAEQTDDFGLPLVRGPFPSLTAAKEAIAVARSSASAESPLAGRLAGKPAETTNAHEPKRTNGAKPKEPASPAEERAGAAKRPANEPAAERDEPAEAGWIDDLSAADRGRARRLIATLTDAGIPDAEGVVRRDLAGGVPAVAAVAVARAIASLGDDAQPDEVAATVAEGRDDELGVRWRLVDGDGRPIRVDARRPKRKG